MKPASTVPDGAHVSLQASAVEADADRPAVAGQSRSFMPMLLFGVVMLLIFLALGTWQVKRLYWKLDLIDRVTQRVHASPVPAPGRDTWASINSADDEYRHVRVAGSFLYRQTVRVQAVTVRGGGFWLVTPLRQTNGDIVLVNRGFVPATLGAAGADASDTAGPELPPGRAGATPQPIVSVIGLLRMTEPGGAFLRKNHPRENRWYSRDVQAIASADGLPAVAPYFIDADADAGTHAYLQTEARPDAPTEAGSGIPDHVTDAGVAAAPASAVRSVVTIRPVGGLTVIAFQNNHLVYALTWYGLALMTAAAIFWPLRQMRAGIRSGAGARGPGS